jgi:hypothetical protein
VVTTPVFTSPIKLLAMHAAIGRIVGIKLRYCRVQHGGELVNQIVYQTVFLTAKC